MSFAFELLLSAAIMGLVIAFLERADFPGWPESIGSAFGVAACSALTATLLPEGLRLLSLSYVGGALGGGFLISWLCELPVKRGFLAAGIYLVVRVALSIGFGLIS